MSVINGVTVADDNNFSPSPQMIRAGEMTNGYGDTIGDYVGSRYALSYKWDELPFETQTALLAATDMSTYPTISVTHPTLDGTNYTGTYRVVSPLQAEKIQYSAYLQRNVWVNATLGLIEVMSP